MAEYFKLQQPLDRGLRSTPSKVALRTPDATLTYAELDQRVRMVAAGLIDSGVAPKEAVAWLLPNCVEAVVVTLACYRIGAIAVPLNYRYVADEIHDVLKRTTPKLLLFHDGRVADVEPAVRDIEITSIIVGGIAKFARSFDALLTCGELEKAVPVSADDPALILFTSGSTGHPKGVVHSHSGCFHAIDQSRALFDFTADDVVLVGKPISHAGGLQTQMMPVWLAGGEVLLAMRPEPAAAVKLIQSQNVTEYGMLASDLLDFIEYLEANRAELPSLVNAIGSGDSVPSDLHHRFRDLFDWEVMEGAGMTEVGCYYAANPRNGLRKWGSLGLPAPGMTLQIVDAENNPCGTGEQGEIVLQTPSATIGYWQDEIATQQRFRDGWLHTGDLAYQDEDGYIWFVGRKKLMIVRRGSNIAPAEVENVLDEHPSVHASIVVGVADARDGQIPVACVALLEGENESVEPSLREFAKQHLAAYKNPVHYLFLLELPRTGTGKFDRRQLQLLASEYLNKD
ncbi:class I adenylate-forming enzyme family protein [Bremerella sp. T1]|uniref:class I adenylate-forming enzyme family protein n=1 Tax=Bremerella sp. TYQ1 TaxID=3119568 RepID=UPI001CCB376A|nr:class I adenylate-forming enzyme family protein [Bremerella volcania]UBM36832.1 acyl--CoA ligase [Bremerella volcania]